MKDSAKDGIIPLYRGSTLEAERAPFKAPALRAKTVPEDQRSQKLTRNHLRHPV